MWWFEKVVDVSNFWCNRLGRIEKGSLTIGEQADGYATVALDTVQTLFSSLSQESYIKS